MRGYSDPRLSFLCVILAIVSNISSAVVPPSAPLPSKCQTLRLQQQSLDGLRQFVTQNSDCYNHFSTCMSNTNATCDGSCKLDVTPMGDACLEGQDTYCTVKYYSPANGHEHTVYAEFSLTTATCIPHDCGRDDKHALARHMAAEFCNLSGSLAPLFGSYCAVHLSCNYGLSGTDIAIIVSCSVVGVLGTVGCCLWWKRRKTNHTATSGDYDPLLALEEDELPGNDVLLQHNESGL